MVLCAICIADLSSTIFLVSYRDCMEGNPLMSFYLDHGIVAFVLAKATLFVFPLFILEWARRRRPGFAILAARTCICLYLFAYAGTVISLNCFTDDNGNFQFAKAPVAASLAGVK